MNNLPPPDPKWSFDEDLDYPQPSPSVGDRLALASDKTLNFVSRRSWWAKGLLWLFGFIVLLPMLIISETGGSRNGLIGAGALFAAFLIIGAVSEGPRDSEAPTATAPTDRANPSPDAQGPSPSAIAKGSPNPSPEPSPSPAEQLATAGPRGDNAPVIMQGRVVNIVDGDTFDLGNGTRVRLAIADTPEVHGGFETCGPEASDFAGSFLAGETVAIYRPEGAPEYDRFDRLLGEAVRVSDGASLNVALVHAGLARVDERFTDEDPDLAERLRTAQAEAENPQCEQQGGTNDAGDDSDSAPQGASSNGDSVVIATVREDGPGNDVEQYGDSEYVDLRNESARDVDLAGWTVVDEANHRHRVPSGFTILAGQTFRIYSGDGDDDPASRYYIGLTQAYLNNGGDTIRLFDSSGTEVDRYSY